MIDTYNGVEGTNRDLEREAAEWMIAQRPYLGWGFYPKNTGYAASLSELGAHSGYLEIFKQMGYPCGIIFFTILAIPVVHYVISKFRYKIQNSIFFALVLSLAIKANFESLYIGVHEYGTNLFFFALAMMCAERYHAKCKAWQ
jgi:hypothetical protein